MTVCNFIHPQAGIGMLAKIWHFAVIHEGVIIHDYVSVGSNAEIGKYSQIGQYTRISAHVFLPPRSIIGSNVFIGPGTVFTDDKNPRAGNTAYKAEPPIVEDHASIGAGCVILPGVRIGSHAVIGAGSVVTKDVPPFHTFYGEAAKDRTEFEPLRDT